MVVFSYLEGVLLSLSLKMVPLKVQAIYSPFTVFLNERARSGVLPCPKIRLMSSCYFLCSHSNPYIKDKNTSSL